ncbi:MAG: sulfatase-like hydrolase/transferase [Treponema sp.]|nr:sulfatase-like hydrolase/transferase [Treponema sp.]
MNFLLIICDQLRQDALGFYGNKIIKTPNIDNLANESAVFTNAYCASPLCVPARISILTGRYVISFAGGHSGSGHSAAPRLSHLLKEAGYHTAALGKMHFDPCTSSYGFDRFVKSEDTSEHRQYKDDYQQYLAQKGLFEWGHGLDNWDIVWTASLLKKEDYVTTWNGDQAVEYLRSGRPKDRPFFCVCSFPKPHPPFDPPKPYDTMYDPQTLPLPKGCIDPIENKPQTIRQWQQAWDFNFCMQRRIQSNITSHYYGNISLIDDQIGRITETLREQKIYDDTVILFLSDHGEQLGDQRCFMKHFGYESSIHIPMFIKAPGIRPGTCDRFVNQTDIVPTICSLAGISAPPRADGLDLLKTYSGKAPEREYSVSNSAAGGGWFSIQTKKWKYIYYLNGGEHELYDISNGCEEENLARNPNYAGQVKTMQSALIEWLSALQKNSDPGAPLYTENGKLKFKPYNDKIFNSIKRRPLAHRIPDYLT